MSGFSRFLQSCLSSLSTSSRIAKRAFALLVPGLLSCAAPSALVYAQTPTPVPVLTWRYDLTHAGQNTNETALTPENVTPSSFGKLFSLKVDSTVYAQPLYVPGLKMSDGQVHNVLFVATSNDSIYAFDADSNGGSNATPIWKISLLDAAHGSGAGAVAIDWHDTTSPDVAPTVGIVGTPAINPATNTMYVVAASNENGTYYSRLHAINILNGQEQPNSPVAIQASVAGTGNGSSNGQLSFSPLWQNQRTAVNYYDGHVYFGYGAHGDSGPWHGWLFSYDATTLAQTDVLCFTPNGVGAGIWASGAGLPIDTNVAGGLMFVVTGNGTRGSLQKGSYTNELGESIIAFNLTNGKFNAVDEFTPYNYQSDLNAHDWDLGAGGILMLPDQAGAYPHMLVQGGKEGRLTVLNRDNLGGYSGGTSDPNALQEITGITPQGEGFWSTPAYWNDNVYVWPEKGVPMLFKINGGVMDGEPASQGSIATDFPNPTFSVSSNGPNDGIAWAIRADQFNSHGPAVLYGWNANDLSTPIYESDSSGNRDTAGAANKFAVPVVTNGKVYVACNGEVDVYGLLNDTPITAAPVISPNGGTFAAAQTVSLSSPTSSAQIFYTSDGSTPTPGSTLYTGPITVTNDTTINAMASAPGFLQSSTTSATFNFSGQTPLLSVTPAGGTYLNAQTVTITDPDTNAKIYYTTDGTTPSASSNPYTGSIQVAANETLQSIAIDPSLRASNIDVEKYVIQNGGTSIDFSQGFSNTAGLQLNGTAVATNDTRLQLTNGGTNQAGSVFWNAPINIQAFTTTFRFQMTAAMANGFTFTIQNIGPTALGGNSAGLGYQDIAKSVAVKFNFYNYQNEGNNSTGVYTNGQPPVNPSIDMSSSGVFLNSNDAIDCTISYDGTTLNMTLHDGIANKTYTMPPQQINIPATVGGNTAYVGFTGATGGLTAGEKLLTWTYATMAASPTMNPSAGTYSSTQNVTLSSGTSDAAIYYTTDGSVPNPNTAAVYKNPIAVSTTETINAIAISPTVGSSNQVTGAYTIQSAPAGFNLSGTSTGSIAQGNTATSTVTVTPTNGFTGNVALTCTIGQGPSGATDVPTCTVSQPPSVSGSQAVTATITIVTTATTTPGTYVATISGASGGITANTVENVVVTGSAPPPPAGNFALSGNPVSITSPGGSGTSIISISPSGGFAGNVTLACSLSDASNATSAPTCTITPSVAVSANQPATATLTINTQSTTKTGAYTVNVTGTSGALSQSTAVSVNVVGSQQVSQFTLSGTAVTVGSSGTNAATTITITPSGGFTGTVNLACAVTTVPDGVTTKPNCTITQPPAIAGAQAVTATVTLSPAKASTTTARTLPNRLIPLGGAGTIAALLIFVPCRRRKWQTLLGLLVFVAVVAGTIGCGSGAQLETGGNSNSSNLAPGVYTVTVTGTSGAAQSTTTVNITVQ